MTFAWRPVGIMTKETFDELLNGHLKIVQTMTARKMRLAGKQLVNLKVAGGLP